jgi:Caspase domain
MRVWDIATGDERARMISLDKGKDWLVVTPEGLFDGSPGGRQKVMYRIGNGLNVVPVDRFFQDFYRPGLLAEVSRGGAKPVPEVKMARAQPPQLKIATPQSGTIATAEATLDATDQGGGIANLAIYQNGARVLAPGQSRTDGKTIHRTFTVALVEGRNHLRITASTADGSWESEPAELVLTYERPLAKSRLFLVAVGVNRYADANLNLKYAASDAQAFAELFRRRGAALYDRVQATTLLDDKATKQSIHEALKQIAADTKPQDTLVLFLAGHGTMVGQRYYFVPHELRRQAELLEDDIRHQAIPADELSDDLGSAKALKRMLILDTCASGGALALTTKGRSGFALRGAIERLSRTQGIFTIAASSASEEAQQSKQLGHGVLSYALLAGLKATDGGPLDGQFVRPSNPEGVVDVLEWFSFAAGQVPRLTEKLYGAAQDVQTSAQGASFPVLPLEAR